MQLLLLAALALAAPAAARLGDSGDTGGDNGATIDADEVQNQLGAMMAETNAKLSKAEAHHQQRVTEARDDILEDYDETAGTMAQAVQDYETGLIHSEITLESAVNSSKAGLAAAAKAPGAMDWTGPSFMEKAKLSAQVGTAERNLRRMRRKRAAEVRSAMNRAEEPLEDETERLGLVVGDLSTDMSAAKEKIEDTLDLVETSGNMTRDALKNLPKVKADAPAKDAKGEQLKLQVLEKDLAATVKNTQEVAAEADRALNAALEKESTNQTAKAAGVKKDFADAQKKEMASVSDEKQEPVAALSKLVPAKAAPVAAPAKAAPAAKKEEKAAPAAKKEKKAAPAAKKEEKTAPAAKKAEEKALAAKEVKLAPVAKKA